MSATTMPNYVPGRSKKIVVGLYMVDNSDTMLTLNRPNKFT